MFRPDSHTPDVGRFSCWITTPSQSSAPVKLGCTQQSGSQSVPKPWNVPVHSPAVRPSVHAPVASLQHAPVVHGSLQKSPIELHSPPPAATQSAAVVHGVSRSMSQSEQSASVLQSSASVTSQKEQG